MPRMSAKDFIEREPTGKLKGDFGPSGPGYPAIWEEAKRARDSEARLIEALKDIIMRQRLAYNCSELYAHEMRAWDIPADIARAALKGAE